MPTNIAWTDETWNPVHGCSRVFDGCDMNNRKNYISSGCSDVMPKGQPGEDNPNWKGGRTITEHGYVLVKLTEHPDSDTRGYVYEHRLIAEKMLERRLEEDEQVHHKNHDKQDNRPENLEVVTIAEHRLRHRDSEDLREPGEQNPTIECSCGCGGKLRKYDSQGRPRKYISGHNAREQESPLQDAVIQELSDGPMHRGDLADRIDRSVDETATVLSRLRKQGRVEPVNRGVWGIKDE